MKSRLYIHCLDFVLKKYFFNRNPLFQSKLIFISLHLAGVNSLQIFLHLPFNKRVEIQYQHQDI